MSQHNTNLCPAKFLNKLPFWLHHSGPLADSKHNQTLWSFSRVELKAFCAESFGGNLQLPSACECSLHWNLSISSLHSSCPPRKPPGSYTVDRVIQAPWGGGLPSSSKFLDLSGKRFPYKPTGVTPVYKGRGQPPSPFFSNPSPAPAPALRCACKSDLVGQLS